MVIILDGYHGSGKTAFCKRFKSNNPEWNCIHIDYALSSMGACKTIRHIKECIKSGNVVIDCYFKNSLRWLLMEIMKICKYNSIDFCYTRMNTSLRESYIRFVSRQGYVSFFKYLEICELNTRKL